MEFSVDSPVVANQLTASETSSPRVVFQSASFAGSFQASFPKHVLSLIEGRGKGDFLIHPTQNELGRRKISPL